jgi:C-terminal processing protease CtpA/Prc
VATHKHLHIQTSIKITIANWLTPNGSTISGKGIEPQIAVTDTTIEKNTVTNPTIKRALEFLRTGK